VSAPIPAPKTREEWQQKSDFIVELCKWKNLKDKPYLSKTLLYGLDIHLESIKKLDNKLYISNQNTPISFINMLREKNLDLFLK